MEGLKSSLERAGSLYQELVNGGCEI